MRECRGYIPESLLHAHPDHVVSPRIQSLVPQSLDVRCRDPCTFSATIRRHQPSSQQPAIRARILESPLQL